jgi:hypothetical protein
MSRCVHIALCVCVACSTCSLISCPPTFSPVVHPQHSFACFALSRPVSSPRLKPLLCVCYPFTAAHSVGMATGLPANKSVTTPIVNFCACFRVLSTSSRALTPTHPPSSPIIRPPTQLGRVRMGESAAVLFPPVDASRHMPVVCHLVCQLRPR